MTFLVETIVVVNAVGDIRGLLDFCQITAVKNGMDTTCWNEEAVTVLDIVFGQCVADGFVFYHLLVFLRCYLHLQTIIDSSTRLRVHDIPHLGFTTRFALTACYLVSRMHLDGEVTFGIDKLDEQRKLIAEAAIVGFAHQTGFLLLDNVVEVLSLTDGLTAWNTGNLPDLSTPN